MKTIQRLLIGIVGVLALLIVVAFLLPSKWEVQRSVEIQAAPAKIDPYVSNLNRWPEWIPWTKDTDVSLQYIFSGAENGIGAIMTWEGEKMGRGAITITDHDPNRGIWYLMSFGNGQMPSEGSLTYTTIVNNGTKVMWADSGNLGNNPVNRYVGLLMSSMLGADFEKGLAKLKRVVESQK